MSEGAAFSTLTPLKPLMDACVHCGFCLQTCPSYRLLGNEAASPRGRIYLMRAGLEERLPLTANTVAHFDTCLGCMACETACPSGVRYAPLIEETRAAIETHHVRPFGERLFRRMLFLVLPYPRRLRLLDLPTALARLFARSTAILDRLPARARSLLALAEALPSRRRESLPVRIPAAGETRLRVGLVTGCVQAAYFSGVNGATARILSAEGCEVAAPKNQGCCGALALHAGENDEARRFARRLIAAFEGQELDQIVINAAGCGSTMKTYGELLEDDPEWSGRAHAFASRVRDISETLAHLEPSRAQRHPVTARVAYHDACHLAHAQRVRDEPRRLLASIPGLTVVPLADSDICCGSAGIFNLVQPEMAQALGQRKAASVADAKADFVVTSNPGCLVQITSATRTAGAPARVVHLAELLDASINKTAL